MFFSNFDFCILYCQAPHIFMYSLSSPGLKFTLSNCYLSINYRARGSVTATKVQCLRDVTFYIPSTALVQIIGIFDLTYG